jgi:hypothetical protein
MLENELLKIEKFMDRFLRTKDEETPSAEEISIVTEGQVSSEILLEDLCGEMFDRCYIT